MPPRKRKPAKKKPPTTTAELIARPSPPVEEWSVKADIERCTRIAPGGWLTFTIAKAPWHRFSVHKSIEDAFRAPMGTNPETMMEWLKNAETALSSWVLREIILKEDHVEKFRSLGRGWLFLLLRRQEQKFKVWWESVRRVETTHEMDIERVHLTPAELTKHTYGYTPNTELVFFFKGLTSAATISIQKLHPEYRDLRKWANSEELMQRCKIAHIPTDEERRRIAAKRLKKQRQKLAAAARSRALAMTPEGQPQQNQKQPNHQQSEHEGDEQDSNKEEEGEEQGELEHEGEGDEEEQEKEEEDSDVKEGEQENEFVEESRQDQIDLLQTDDDEELPALIPQEKLFLECHSTDGPCSGSGCFCCRPTNDNTNDEDGGSSRRSSNASNDSNDSCASDSRISRRSRSRRRSVSTNERSESPDHPSELACSDFSDDLTGCNDTGTEENPTIRVSNNTVLFPVADTTSQAPQPSGVSRPSISKTKRKAHNRLLAEGKAALAAQSQFSKLLEQFKSENVRFQSET